MARIKKILIEQTVWHLPGCSLLSGITCQAKSVENKLNFIL
jgi:hypothetical protein